MRIAVVFPGQASQFPGMGRELYETWPVARAVFEEASQALGLDLAALCFKGSREELTLTENAQPAIFTVSVAAFRVLEEEIGLAPLCAAGHSLGEYSALVAAGVLALPEAVRVLRLRGKYMQEAVPPGQGAMAAVIGLPPEKVEQACREASSFGVVAPANFNGADQIVISGEAEAVRVAGQAAKAAGAKRVLLLPVSAPFHCPLMAPAARRLAPELVALSQGRFFFPVVANVTAAPYPPGEPVAHLLERQVTAAVRWAESVAAMRAMGAEAWLEVGPGTVLAGLVRRMDPEARVCSFGGPSDLEAARVLAG